jgi:hypothetical protein
MVTCSPGEILDDCIPNCDASTNGDVLLVYKNGNDIHRSEAKPDFNTKRAVTNLKV